MADLENEDTCEVGYCKPPKSTRFQKGTSGNPNGRPKGSRSLANTIRRDSRQMVKINGPRGSTYITKEAATILQVGNKAASGDLRASGVYLSLLQFAEQTEQNLGSPKVIHERDAAARKNLFDRIQRRRADKAPLIPSDAPKSEDPQ